MSLGKSLRKGYHKWLTGFGYYKKGRKALGLTSKNKWVRQLKRSLRGGQIVSSSQPTSAATYQHNVRTLSQMTGGV